MVIAKSLGVICRANHATLSKTFRQSRPRVDNSRGTTCSVFDGLDSMPRRAIAMMAVIAVIIHCVVGCCARCVNACDCPQADDCSVACCPYCDHHDHDSQSSLCCQPVRNVVATDGCHDHQDHNEHECIGCGKHRCPFIPSESICDGLHDVLTLSACVPTFRLPLFSIVEKSKLGRDRFAGTLSPFPKAELRLHLALTILTI